MATNVKTEVPGNVWQVCVSHGDRIEAGGVLFILEVMKTEVPHEASQAGRVKAVNIQEGQEGVDAGMIAVTIG